NPARSKPRLAQPRRTVRRRVQRRTSDREDRDRTVRVQGLLEAATAVTSSLSLDTTLRLAADEARRLVGAQAAAVSLHLDTSQTVHVVSTSEAYDAWQQQPEPAMRAAFL